MKSFGSILSTMPWISVVCVCAGTVSRAADLTYAGLEQSVIAGLEGMKIPEPVSGDAFSNIVPAATTPSTFTFATEVRSSTPRVDRSRSYASADPFAGTRAVLPLLVLDLDPTRPVGVRPMTGRSVGARPSLPLARPESR